MPLLLSGSQKNSSSPSGFITLANTQYQLGPTPTIDTGYTLVANSGSRITFVSSLGNLEFDRGSIYSNLDNQNVRVIGTGTSTVIVSGSQANVSTTTGVLVVQGGIGIAKGLHTGDDIYVNGLRIGQGYQGTNNLVITGTAKPITNTNDFDGENNVAIGWSALGGISSAQNSIGIGRYALASGTNLTNTVAIGDSSLSKAGSVETIFVGNINAINTGTSTTVTVNNHGLTTGSAIIISGITGSLGSNLNGNKYLTKVISANTFSLYNFVYPDNLYNFSDNSVYSLIDGKNLPIDSRNYGIGSMSSATVRRSIVTYSNIGIGANSGQSFYNGQHNFFIGDSAASNFTTGSFNFFIGYNVSSNMISGNNNISFNSKVMKTGQDNQIGLGAVFYYDGVGITTLSSGVLLGDPSYYNEATGAFNSTGALQVYGGVGVKGSVYVGNNLNVTGTGTVTLTPINQGSVSIYPANTTGNLDNMIIGARNAQSSTFFSTVVTSAIDSTSASTGALQVINGGAGISKSLYVGLKIDTSTANIRSSLASTSTTTGAVTIAGGVGVRGSIYSKDGNPDENNLLYSPRVTVSTSTPAAPHIGDFWINVNTLAEYQYIIDGTSTFWIQIAQL